MVPLVNSPEPSIVMVAYMGGAITAGCLVAAMFFLRFWMRAREGLFLAFALAFVLLALNQTLPVLMRIPGENLGQIYLLRLAAFLLIIGAVLTKNLGRRL